MKNQVQTIYALTSGRASFMTALLRLKSAVLVAAGLAAALALPASATPVFHGISAANVTVQQNDASNNAVSVTVTSSLSINQFHALNGPGSGNSRADYFVQIGTNATDNVTNGILISSITDNGRDNGEGNGTNYGTSAVDSNTSGNPGSSGQWWVPVFGSPTMTSATFPEYNFDFAAAYFPYRNGWYGGWLVNKGGTNNAITTNIANLHWIGNTNMILGTDVIPLGGGKITVDLRRFGLDSRSNAVLICCGGKNEENFADSQTNADGTWLVTTRDDVSGSAESDPSAFVCVPMSNHMVIAGRFMGDSKVIMQNAPFYVTNTFVGVYHLVIPGVTPGQGVLIISGEEGGSVNGDNIVSYQATADGWDIQTRDMGSTATTAEPNLQNLPATDAVVSFVYIPGPTPGFTVTPTNGLLTSESGASATFSVVLDAPPTSDVTVTVDSSLPSVGIVSTNLLDFDPTNWDVPQVVTVMGVTNTIANGGLQPYTVILGAAVSDDTNYSGMQPPSVGVENVNNNTPGITVWPTNGLVTTESGGTATFYVVLDSQPTGDVAVGISSSNPSEGIAAPALLTFTTDNWNAPQPVTVTGVDDSVVDGTVAYSIVTAPAVSADPNYSGLDSADVSVANQDNEVAGVTFSPGTSLSVVEGSSTNFTVALSAQPVSNVTITLASGNSAVGTLSPTTLNFTTDNWNVAQPVTLTGVDNSANSGNVTYPITVTVTSVNPGYSTLVVSNLSATTLVKTALLMNSNLCVYGFGMPPVGLDGQALLESSSASFAGASLSAQVVSNADSGDIVTLRNDGTNDGQIGITGNTVNYGGTAIGSFSGGSGSAALSITLSNGVTLDAVQSLIHAIAFGTATRSSYAQRTVRVTLNDGEGAVVSATKNVRVGLLRVMQFQDGADSGYGTYGGEDDVELSQIHPDTAFPSGDNPANGLFVDAPTPGIPEEDQTLMRFDNLIGTNANQIPPGSIIVSAELHINIINTGNGFTLNRMLIPWDATNATWDSFGDGFGDNGIFPDDITARSEYDSQLGVYIVDPNTGAVSGSTTGTGNVALGVTPDIQAWANGDTNCGWVMRGFPQETDGLGFSPSEDPILANRPMLTVYWVPTNTASATFRYGVNGYTNVSDTNIRQASGDVNYATEATLWSDANDVGQADATEALLQFNNIVGTDSNSIPPNVHVEVAMLDLGSVNSDAAIGNGGQFFAMLQPWQDTNTTWNSWGANGIMTDGVMAAATPTAAAGTPALTVKFQAAFHSFEVTPDVQKWVNGTPNYGWAVIPWPNGSDGWGMDSSEDVVTNNRPQLRVFYTVSAPTPPKFQSVSMISGQLNLSLTGVPNTTYTVLRAPSPIGPWLSIGTTVTGTDGTASFTDTTPPPDGAFYRLSN